VTRNKEDTMQFVLMIYHGTYPLPGTPEFESVSEEEKKAAYADYATLNEMENVTPGPPLGLPENATTVRVPVRPADLRDLRRLLGSNRRDARPPHRCGVE
jgi:hypothetical protein